MNLTLVEAVRDGLDKEMELDEDVIILGEDVGVNGGVFRATDGLLKKYPGRVIDTPLSESGIVGTSFGMALFGLKPVAEIQFSGFIYPAFDQIISHISRIRTRSRGKFYAQMVIRAPYGGGVRAPEHHSESMEAIYIHTPGVKVVIPSNPYDAKGLLISSIRERDPVIFLEPKRLYRAFRQEVPEENYTVDLEKAKIVREGEDITIISYGAMMRIALDCAEKLSERISSEVIDLRTLYPLDIRTVINSVKKTGRCVILHEGPRTCGLASEIIAQINEKALFYLEAPVERVTGYDTIFPLYKLEKYYLPDTEKLLRAIEKVMSF